MLSFTKVFTRREPDGWIQSLEKLQSGDANPFYQWHKANDKQPRQNIS